jgi:predicted nuclease of predicted toxin-antitoxin system
MIRLLTDENLDHDLVRGVLRQRSELDLVQVHSVGLAETDDRDILAWAAREQRVVVTHDVNTMRRSPGGRRPLKDHQRSAAVG